MNARSERSGNGNIDPTNVDQTGVDRTGHRPTVFLDRDGTINVDSGYVTSPERLELIPGASEAMGSLARAGFRLVIVSNQSAIGRGRATVEEVDATNQQLIALLAAEDPDAWPDLILYCPHAPSESCECRKPGIGLVKSAGLEFDPTRSWMFGDKLSDIRFGVNLGLPLAQCLLVLTGEGRSSLAASGEEFPGLRTFPDIRLGAAAVLAEKGP